MRYEINLYLFTLPIFHALSWRNVLFVSEKSKQSCELFAGSEGA